MVCQVKCVIFKYICYIFKCTNTEIMYIIKLRGSDNMIYSSIEKINGVPRLLVNGEPIPDNAYITYMPENARYNDFSEVGYKLFSVTVHFSTRCISEMNEYPPFAPGIFENEIPDFSILDATISQILDVCPDAMIFPRVNTALPLRWEIENPDELCDRGNVNPNKRRPCFASDKWAEEVKKYLGMFLDYVDKSFYRDNIIGYQLADGNSCEWFPYDLDGSKGKRSREKFAEFSKMKNIEGTEEEYYAFISRLTADRICEFAEFVKNKTDHRLIVGSFYGYTFDVPTRGWATFSLSSILNNENIDFLCSPISYMNNRALGMDNPNMMAIESLKEHNKLYFVENDTRTHLTKPLFDVPHFHNEYWEAKDIRCALENIKQHYARALTHSHALWWFDMGGGWYHYSAYMNMMRDFLEITKKSLKKNMSGISEVALIADEKVVPEVHNNQLHTVHETLSRGRINLGLMGTPYDTYLSEDYDIIKHKYKAFIILSPYLTKDLKKITDTNKNCLAITYENHGITTDELREFLRKNNVHIYSDKDAVIYANKSYFFIHTTQVGKAEIKMPKGKKLKQIYGDEIDIESDILPKHTGYLFEITEE